MATQSFPVSPFQFQSLALLEQQQHQDMIPLPSSPLTGPSGLSVTVRFLKQQQQQQQQQQFNIHADVNVNGTDASDSIDVAEQRSQQSHAVEAQ
jgi:hypothetical protein